MARPTLQPSESFLTALAILLSLLHAMLAVTATAEKSMTADEIAHLTAGQAYNTRGDYRLQPENGNLPQRLAALPMTLAGDALPPSSLEIWRTADVWRYGHAFFYDGSLSSDERLFQGRAMIALVSAATALLVFFWARTLFGWSGGFLALTLYSLCPTMLAHGALATSDMTMAFFFLASVGAWWRHLENPGVAGASLSAATLGLAFVSKFSAVLLPPMLGLIAGVWLWRTSRLSGWKAPLLRLARSTVAHALTTWLVIWAFYGFRFSAFAPELAEGASFNHGWDWVLTGIGLPGQAIWWLREWRLLPEAWLHGLAFVLQFSRARGAFMSGEYSVTGWVSFFPWAFLIKTPLPLLLLFGTGAIMALRRCLALPIRATLNRLLPLTPLAVLFVLYWAVSLLSHLNIGHRHLLPVYPVLFIATGWLARAGNPRRPPALVACIAGLTLWHAGESLGSRPHHLAYFNQIVGGPSNGWRHLVDSSLDWGQDLRGLKAWVDKNAAGSRIHLAYFGTADARYEGIDAIELPKLPAVGPSRPWHPLRPGIYAVSATMLQHVYSQQRGPWTPEAEMEFQRLRPLEPLLLEFQNDATRRAALLREAPEQNWKTAWTRYEILRFARLCHFLRVRRPEAVIGHSIFVFRLDADEISAATGSSLQEWSRLIERSAAGTAP